ncbi:MAG: PorV/PorQ family protein [Bacteroidota bacterium]
MTYGRYIAGTVLLALLGAHASGQTLTKTGTTAAAFLKFGVGPRAIGMGGAFTATADDITSMYWNVGGLANVYANEAYFNHAYWFADVNFDYAAVSTHIPGFGSVGAFVTVLSMDEMEVRTLELPEGTGELFKAGGLAVGLSYARNLTDAFSIGFTAKYLREYIWNSSATGFAIDIGTMYRIPILNETRLAASINNFGTKMQLSGRDNTVIMQIGGTQGNIVNADLQLDQFDLPLLFRFGLAVDAVKAEPSRLTLALDAVHPNDNTEYLNTGLEYAWNEIIFLRGGWKSLLERDGEQGLTLGFGVNAPIIESVRIRVDYAYQDFGRLTNVQYLSVGMRF